MQIPLTLPEQITPLPTRRDIQALSPVSPVPGVEGIAETLDPRLAVQWTQPVLADQSADPTRTALEGMVITRPDTRAATAPPPTALSAQTVTWSLLAQALAPLLQRIRTTSPDASVPWPDTAPSPTSGPAVADTSAQALLSAMDSLHHRLAASDLFAPQHLLRHWFKGADTQVSSSATPSTPVQDTQSRWVSALSPESATAEQITRMLLTGKMHWQGELLPGIAVQLDREDAWREDSAHPGQMQKGAALRAQIDLPRSGRLTVTAYQWGSHLDLRVTMPHAPDSPLHQAWPRLQDQLAQLNLPGLHVERAAAP
ncbi:MAG: hypothetical protein RJA69_2424 [Pseudomonadota bacterium]|jgi:hypothetical protein